MGNTAFNYCETIIKLISLCTDRNMNIIINYYLNTIICRHKYAADLLVESHPLKNII